MVILLLAFGFLVGAVVSLSIFFRVSGDFCDFYLISSYRFDSMSWDSLGVSAAATVVAKITIVECFEISRPALNFPKIESNKAAWARSQGIFQAFHNAGIIVIILIFDQGITISVFCQHLPFSRRVIVGIFPNALEMCRKISLIICLFVHSYIFRVSARNIGWVENADTVSYDNTIVSRP